MPQRQHALAQTALHSQGAIALSQPSINPVIQSSIHPSIDIRARAHTHTLTQTHMHIHAYIHTYIYNKSILLLLFIYEGFHPSISIHPFVRPSVHLSIYVSIQSTIESFINPATDTKRASITCMSIMPARPAKRPDVVG